MGEIIRIVAVGIVGVFAIITIRGSRPDIAILLTIAVSIIIILMTLDKLESTTSYFKSIITITGVDQSIFAPLLKIVAIGYLGEFGANICQDSGVTSIADKIIFSTKIIILILAMPIVRNMLDLLVGLL